MRNAIAAPIAVLCLTSVLVACSPGTRTFVYRSSENGEWRVDARVRVANGIADFECRHSASGRCHYTLFGDCDADADTACEGKLLQSFSLAVNDHHRLAGLPDFRLCVNDRAGQPHPVCNLKSTPGS